MSTRYRLLNGDERWFWDNYPTTPNKEIARRYGITEVTVINYAARMGLKKDADYMVRQRIERLERLAESRPRQLPPGPKEDEFVEYNNRIMQVTPINEATPLWQLTVGQFRQLVSECTNGAQSNGGEDKEVWSRGIDALAAALQVSKTTAFRIKQSGVIDEAVRSSVGSRCYWINIPLALKLYRAHLEEKARQEKGIITQ